MKAFDLSVGYSLTFKDGKKFRLKNFQSHPSKGRCAVFENDKEEKRIMSFSQLQKQVEKIAYKSYKLKS